MNKQETQKTLDQFKDFVIAKSKANLASMNKDASKKLSNSIDGVAKVMPNSFTLDFTMEKYGLYQDKGVSGVMGGTYREGVKRGRGVCHTCEYYCSLVY